MTDLTRQARVARMGGALYVALTRELRKIGAAAAGGTVVAKLVRGMDIITRGEDQ